MPPPLIMPRAGLCACGDAQKWWEHASTLLCQKLLLHGHTCTCAYEPGFQPLRSGGAGPVLWLPARQRSPASQTRPAQRGAVKCVRAAAWAAEPIPQSLGRPSTLTALDALGRGSDHAESIQVCVQPNACCSACCNT
eukprot:3233743-Pleurochrysis_carterae.AAC.1